MSLLRSALVGLVIMGGAATAGAAPISIEFVDIHAPSDGVLINNANPSYSFTHDILAPSEAPPSYNPLTDTLDGAELLLMFEGANQGSDAITVSWSNFDNSMTGGSPTITGAFGPSESFGIAVSFLVNQGLLNVTVTKGNSTPGVGPSWTFVSSQLTVEATRDEEDETGTGNQAPEPATLVLFGMALLGGAARFRRRRLQ